MQPNRQTAYKRRLPYAKSAAEFIQRCSGPKDAIEFRIYTGRQAWQDGGQWHEYAKVYRPRPVLVFPLGENPADYDWSVASGCWPMLIETGDTHYNVLRHIAYQLLKAGAVAVTLLFWDGTQRPGVGFKREPTQ